MFLAALLIIIWSALYTHGEDISFFENQSNVTPALDGFTFRRILLRSRHLILTM